MVSRLSQDLGMNSYPPLPYFARVGVSIRVFDRPIRLPSCCSLILSILFRILFRPPALQIQGFDYSIECVGMEEAHSGILAV
ncbi:hypothetical protein AMTRI_Chr06g197620 [Amborella trichopoda]